MYRALAVTLCVGLSGCAATIPPAQLATPERLSPIPSSTGQSKTIYIANVAAKLIDKKIGQMKGGTLCVGSTDLIWGDNPGVLSAMREQMGATLSKHGYNVYMGLIQTSGERDADVLIGAAIENFKANICYSLYGMKGAASLTLKWEVLDNKTKKSSFLSASGVADIPEFSRTGDPDVFVKAIEMAVENILAQQAFFQATRR